MDARAQSSKRPNPALGTLLESEDGRGVVPRIDLALLDLDLRGMRKILLSLLASLAILVAPAAGQAAVNVTYKSTNEQQVLTLLNQIRQQNGLSRLAFSAPLRNAARAHSADMLQRSFFDHNSPTETWDARIARYLKAPLTGENIAMGSGSLATPASIVTQWMQSPPHRAIILTADLHRVGLGLAGGSFQGTSGMVMATADFAA
jgi:uncharacterized protein YkwD